MLSLINAVCNKTIKHTHVFILKYHKLHILYLYTFFSFSWRVSFILNVYMGQGTVLHCTWFSGSRWKQKNSASTGNFLCVSNKNKYIRTKAPLKVCVQRTRGYDSQQDIQDWSPQVTLQVWWKLSSYICSHTPFHTCDLPTSPPNTYEKYSQSILRLKLEEDFIIETLSVCHLHTLYQHKMC